MHKNIFRLSLTAFFVIVIIVAVFAYLGKRKDAQSSKNLPSLFTRIAAPETCSHQIGFASSCWENGLRLLRIIDASLADGMANVTLKATMPSSVPSAIIAPTAYWWSASHRQWQPIILQGFTYKNSVWKNRSAYATFSLPQKELAKGPNYLITWDYLYDARTGWTGPRCTSGTKTDALNSCWRLAVFTLE